MKEDGETVRPDPVRTEMLGPIDASTTDEALKKRAREFDDAIYADFACRAKSEQAKSLVESVFQSVIDYEASLA